MRFAIIIFVLLIFAMGALPIMLMRRDAPGLTAITDTLIDDFSGRPGLASIGTRWLGVHGKKVVPADRNLLDWKEVDGRKVMTIRARVSKEDEVPFQVALPLNPQGNYVDASDFTGIRVHARGNGREYYVQLKTARTERPWKYYQQGFKTTDDWETFDLPFNQFVHVDVLKPIQTDALSSIVISAPAGDYDANLALSRIEFYKE